MLYGWLVELKIYFQWLNAFEYLTTRAVMSMLTAFFIGIFSGPFFIAFLQQLKMRQAIRSDGPSTHSAKLGTPTMGGLIILLPTLLTSLLWGKLSNGYLWITLVTMVSFAFIGFVDDYLKVSQKNPKGLASRYKFLMQVIFAFGLLSWLFFSYPPALGFKFYIPFFKHFEWSLGWWSFLLIGFFVVVGASNSVNMTDGLDGLAIVPSLFVVFVLAIYIYVTGNVVFAGYLHIPYVAGVGELVVFCGAFIGAGIAFLWFNSHPAQIFMGDVGSLSIGAVLGMLAVIIRQEVVFFIIGGLFVAETLSVFLQVGSYKLRGGKRIFRMAPLHHHFELKGLHESKVIIRFWIVAAILAVMGLVMLKLR